MSRFLGNYFPNHIRTGKLSPRIVYVECNFTLRVDISAWQTRIIEIEWVGALPANFTTPSESVKSRRQPSIVHRHPPPMEGIEKCLSFVPKVQGQTFRVPLTKELLESSCTLSIRVQANATKIKSYQAVANQLQGGIVYPQNES